MRDALNVNLQSVGLARGTTCSDCTLAELDAACCAAHSPAQIVQLEMEKLSIQRSADTDRHSAERLHAIDDQLILLEEEQQARAP